MFPPRIELDLPAATIPFRPSEADTGLEKEVVMPSERHHELPARLDFEYYRKQAKDLLKAYRTGDSEARTRVGEVVGERPRRFGLTDAQFVLATEHGFRSWADFRHSLEADPEPARPVGRIGVDDETAYEPRAHELVAAIAAADESAVRRLRAYVPRYADVPDSELAGAEIPLRDAKLLVAREYGFPTWRDLVRFSRKAKRDYEADKQPKEGALAEAIDAIRAGHAERLEALLAENPELVRAPVGAGGTLLGEVAQPDVFGDGLSTELGVDRRCVELLIEAGSDVDIPLNLAACFNRVELVELLLHVGANPTSNEIWGVTALETALYHGAAQAADVLARREIVPYTLWTVAGSGRLDLVQEFFDGQGRLRPDAGAHRPNPADVGGPPRVPPRDDPAEILGEALIYACHNNRADVVRWLLERGVDANARPLWDATGLHFAVGAGRQRIVELLVAYGADPTIRDEHLRVTPLELAKRNLRQRPQEQEVRVIHELLARTAGGGS
jgi:Ankyrin repeats (3 copies)